MPVLYRVHANLLCIFLLLKIQYLSQTMLTFLLTYLIHKNLFCIAQSLFNIHGDLINFHKKQLEVKPPNICI